MTIHAVLDIEDGKAARIRDLLGRLPSVEMVDCLANEDGRWCQFTLLCVVYDSLSRPVILEAAAKMKLALVRAGAQSAIMAADALSSQIGDIEGIFRSLGASVSVVQAAAAFREERAEEIRAMQPGCRSLVDPLDLAEPTRLIRGARDADCLADQHTKRGA